MSVLDMFNEIHRTLGQLRHDVGKIKGELVEVRKVCYRLSMVEQCQAWLKGAWAVLAAALAYVFHGIYAR